MHQVIEIILATQPADLADLRLLANLRANPPTLAELIALAPQIDQAVKELDSVTTETRKIVEKCKTLKPIPSQLIPPGF